MQKKGEFRGVGRCLGAKREVGFGQVLVGREEDLGEEKWERRLEGQDKQVRGGPVCVPVIKRGSDSCGPALAASRRMLVDADDTENLQKFLGQRATPWKA